MAMNLMDFIIKQTTKSVNNYAMHAAHVVLNHSIIKEKIIYTLWALSPYNFAIGRVLWRLTQVTINKINLSLKLMSTFMY
jgi:hypothetical protein